MWVQLVDERYIDNPSLYGFIIRLPCYTLEIFNIYLIKVFMTSEISAEIISSFKNKLETHPVYDAVSTIEDLQCFMEHHIYSVWDFMSLIKYLQTITAPTTYPWIPSGDGSIRRFINELVLEEESDETTIEGQYLSHFELYLKAMDEIGANTSNVLNFIKFYTMI